MDKYSALNKLAKAFSRDSYNEHPIRDTVGTIAATSMPLFAGSAFADTIQKPLGDDNFQKLPKELRDIIVEQKSPIGHGSGMGFFETPTAYQIGNKIAVEPTFLNEGHLASAYGKALSQPGRAMKAIHALSGVAPYLPSVMPMAYALNNMDDTSDINKVALAASGTSAGLGALSLLKKYKDYARGIEAMYPGRKPNLGTFIKSNPLYTIPWLLTPALLPLAMNLFYNHED
jgi:hypothetical protein